MEFDLVDNATQGTVIKVVGVGGAGGNAVQHMINKGVSGVEFICANTDAQALKASKAHNIIQIGDTGLGAGMKPAVGRQLAEDSRSRIEDADFSVETTNLAKSQILSQAATAMLAQANQSQQNVLSLLR